MEEKLNEVLLDGEKIRWSGRPAPFKLLATPSRRSLILTWAICSGALALILGALVPFYIRAQRTMVDLLVLLVITAFLPVMISIAPCWINGVWNAAPFMPSPTTGCWPWSTGN